MVERATPGLVESTGSAWHGSARGQNESDRPDRDPDGMAKLLRDSALVLGLITALLYLASHVFGWQYLGIFEVGAGFQGVGLANLSMIPFEFALGLLIFAGGVYSTLTAPKPWMFILGIVTMLAVGSTRTICALAYDVEMALDDVIPFLISGLTCIVVVIVHAVLIRRMPKFDEVIPALAVETEALEQTFAEDLVKLSELKRLPLLERQYLSRKEDLARLTERTQVLHWKFRIALALASAYFTVIFALPSAATILALGATASERWVPTTADGRSRVPVYWVDDRIVYLTTEAGACFVVVLIDSALETKRQCSPLVRAIKP